MAAGKQPGSWLEDEDPFAQATNAKKEVVDEALIFAQKFLIFTSGPGADLLAHWSNVVRNRKVAPTAGLGELAYHNGMREFVEGLHQQIEFARNGGKSPYVER
jgi:hypothetical protein